jgi:hypothetical protein
MWWPSTHRKTIDMNFAMGVAATVMALILLAGAAFVGYDMAWRDASRVVGCPSDYPIMKDVPDYVGSDGQIRRYVCEADPRWK